jgi:hypothetical protein
MLGRKYQIYQVPCQVQQLQLCQSTVQVKLFLPSEDSLVDLTSNRNLTSRPELQRKNIRIEFCIGIRPQMSGHPMRSSFRIRFQVETVSASISNQSFTVYNLLFNSDKRKQLLKLNF